MIKEFFEEWGVDTSLASRGGIVEKKRQQEPVRQIWMLQRSSGKLGARLGKTTGWIHRKHLKHKNVKMIPDASYEKIDNQGLWYKVKDGETKLLAVDHIVSCVGQEPLDDLYQPLEQKGIVVHKVGGSFKAKELDAKFAIDQATRLAIKV